MKHLQDEVYLKTHSYKTDKELVKRKSLFSYMSPQVDLEGNIIDELRAIGADNPAPDCF